MNQEWIWLLPSCLLFLYNASDLYNLWLFLTTDVTDIFMCKTPTGTALFLGSDTIFCWITFCLLLVFFQGSIRFMTRFSCVVRDSYWMHRITNHFTQKKQVSWQPWFKKTQLFFIFYAPYNAFPSPDPSCASLGNIPIEEDHCAYAIIFRPQFSPTWHLFTSTWFIVKGGTDSKENEVMTENHGRKRTF